MSEVSGLTVKQLILSAFKSCKSASVALSRISELIVEDWLTDEPVGDPVDELADVFLFDVINCIALLLITPVSHCTHISYVEFTLLLYLYR